MIVIGAKGFAKEVLEILIQINKLRDLVFFDDQNTDTPNLLYNKYPIIKNSKDAKFYIDNIDKNFTIGIGVPSLRKKMFNKFDSLGGNLVSTISPNAIFGSHDVEIGKGSNILNGSVFSNSVKLGICCIVYYNTVITHDCVIGDFVEISPSVSILGRVYIGSYSQIGSNVTILPDVKIGRNVIIGAGSVVTKDIPDNCIAYGVPAKVVRDNMLIHDIFY